MTPPRLKAALRPALAVAILGFLVYGLFANWENLRSENIRLVFPQLLLAVAWNIPFFVIQGWANARAMTLLGYKMSLGGALFAWSASQIGKYVPGKVMLPIVRALYCEREGVPKGITVLALYLELVLMIATSAAVFVLFGRDLAPFLGTVFRHPVIPFALVGCGIVGLHPKILSASVNTALRILKKPEIEFNVPYAPLLFLGVVVGAGWFLQGLGASAAVRAIGKDPAAGLAIHTAAFALSWLLGFLSFLTPGGIGVREGVLVLALAPFYSTQSAIAISLVSRLSWVLAEAVMAGALYPFRPRPAAPK